MKAMKKGFISRAKNWKKRSKENPKKVKGTLIVKCTPDKELTFIN